MYVRTKFILLFLMLLTLFFQNCVGDMPVKFFNSRQTLKSELMGGGGGYDGKPENGYYCRVYDNISCQSQVKNIQSLVKVDNTGIHLLQDSCTSTSVNFAVGDKAVEYSSTAPEFLGVTRGIFKRCEVGADNLPSPPTEMPDAYCVSHQDNMTVVVNKDLANNAFSFQLFIKNNSSVSTVRGAAIVKSITSFGSNYFSSSEEFDLKINSSSSQTASGQLQVIVDERPLNINLSCRTASAAPTVILEKDLEISSTWIDTSSLVGYWKLNESNAANGSMIIDSSRFATHGTLLTDDAGLVKTDTSVIGRSLFFDGTNDSVDILPPADGHLNFDTRSFSYMVWIKKTGDAGGFDMPIWQGGSSGGFAGFDIECGSGNRGCMALISDGQRLATSVRSAKFADSGTALIGRWYLLTAVVDRENKQLRAYLDGALISTTDISVVGSVSSNYRLQIGASNYVTTRDFFFMGSIDDVSIWNKALTESEISEIFQRLRPKFY